MRLIILAAALSALAVPASAAPVSYDFRVGVTDGPLAGQELTGSFAIDDSYLASDGAFDDFSGLGIDSIDFSFGGATFSRANADAIFLAVENGRLVDFVLGAAPSGLDLIASGDASADFLLDSFGFGYKLAGVDEFIFSGELIRLFQVPAAPSLALFGLSLVALGMRRRA